MRRLRLPSPQAVITFSVIAGAVAFVLAQLHPHLPFLNTMILLLSGTTITWAHHCLLEGNRKGLIQGLGLTVLLGLSFTMFQAIEYMHAPARFGEPHAGAIEQHEHAVHAGKGGKRSIRRYLRHR